MTVSILSPRFDVAVSAPIVRRYGRWVMASLLAHAVVLGIAGSVAVVQVGEPRPIRVKIFALPAPPPPPLGAGGAPAPRVVSAPVVAPPEPVPARSVEKPRPQKVTRPPKARAAPAPQREIAPQPPAPAPLSGDADTPPQPGLSVGDAAGVPGGVSGGRSGGTVGGQGERLLRADEVATPPVVESSAMPVYPPLARARGIEGLVVLETVIDRSGRVVAESVRVVESVPLLDEAAIDALRKWRFRPGRDTRGEPVRVLVQLPVRFRLR